MRREHDMTTITGATKRKARLGLATAAVIALGGCAAIGSGSGTVHFTNFTAGYDPLSVSASMPLLVETFGSPAPNLPQEAVTAASVEGLRRHGPPWTPRNFSGNLEDTGQRRYVVRIAYGVPQAFNGDVLCKDEMSNAALQSAPGAGDGDSSRTIAGLCRGARAVAYAEGSPSADADIGSERFREFVGLLGRRLMPFENPVLDDDCAFRFCD